MCTDIYEIGRKCLFAVQTGEPMVCYDTTVRDEDDDVEFWIIPESIVVSRDNVIVRDKSGDSWDTNSGWNFRSLGEVCN